MRNKMLSCLRYNLKKLLASPVTYLVIVLTILFVDREILPVRNYLRDSGDLISWPGLLTYLLDYAPLTLLMGLAIIALLSPLPMWRRSISWCAAAARAGRGRRWP